MRRGVILAAALLIGCGGPERKSGGPGETLKGPEGARAGALAKAEPKAQPPAPAVPKTPQAAPEPAAPKLATPGPAAPKPAAPKSEPTPEPEPATPKPATKPELEPSPEPEPAEAPRVIADPEALQAKAEAEGAPPEGEPEPPTAGPEEEPLVGPQEPPIKVEEAQDSDRIKILQGLLSQKERRLAGVLRELAAARESRSKSEIALGRVSEDLARARARVRTLEKDLALARAGGAAAPEPSPAPAGDADERFAAGGLLDPAQVVAKINGFPVTRGELIYRLYYNYALDYWPTFVRIQLVEQEAQRLGVTVVEEECVAWAAKQMAQLCGQNGGEEAFRKRLEEQGKSLDLVEAVLRVNASYGLRVQKIIALRRLSPEGKAALEQQAKSLYDERFGPSLRASHIYFKTRAEKGSPEWVQRHREAEAALARLEAGEPFENLAAELSEDEESAKAGGQLGTIDRERFAALPAFNQRIFAMAEGEQALAFSRVGIHIVKVQAVLPPEKSWEQAKAGLLRELAEAGPTEPETSRLFSDLQESASVVRKLTVD